MCVLFPPPVIPIFVMVASPGPFTTHPIIDKVIGDDPDKVKEYKSGKDKLFGFFVGQVMKISGGKANPQLVNEILKKKLH